jgi:hypothetical protein
MTKKSAFPAALLLIAVGLSGCPLYDDDDSGCIVDSECSPGYVCDGASGDCYADESEACRRPSDCAANETCSRFGTCETGDCHYDSVGCVRGYVCSPDSGRWECVERDAPGSGGAGGNPSSTNGGQAGEPGSAGTAG